MVTGEGYHGDRASVWGAENNVSFLAFSTCGFWKGGWGAGVGLWILVLLRIEGQRGRGEYSLEVWVSAGGGEGRTEGKEM